MKLNRGIARALLCASLFVASGCATKPPHVDASVESFSNIADGQNLGTIFVGPKDAANLGDLQFQSMARKTWPYLMKAGFTPVADASQAKYVAVLEYGIDDGSQITYTSVIPQWGVTGYSAANTYGTVTGYGNYATFNSTTNLTPDYGVTGTSTVTNTATVYKRYVFFTIFEKHNDNAQSPQVYKALIKSTGWCGNLTSVAGRILEAGFKNFPHEFSGAVSVDWDGKC